MKKLILILTILLLFSCRSNLQTYADKRSDVYTIYTITDARSISYVYDNCNEFCEYKATTGKTVVGYANKISFVDTVGKFAINDMVEIRVTKLKNIKE